MGARKTSHWACGILVTYFALVLILERNSVFACNEDPVQKNDKITIGKKD